MSATWYAWGDATFREVTDPAEIVKQDVSAAIDEAENAFFWAPQASFQFSAYRNEGMGPVQLSDVQARTQGVLADGEVIESASAVASFDRGQNKLIADVTVVPADTAPLRLRLTDSPAGFEVTV